MDKQEALNTYIRRADYKDIPILVEIARKSFPTLLKWQIPRFLSRKRWRQILSSESAETWVYSIGNRLSGYVILVRDINSYKLEKHQYNRSLLKKSYYYLLCPRLLLKMLARKISHQSAASSSVARDVVKDNKMESIDCCWIDSIAIDTRMRRKGIATGLLNYCFERTQQFGMDGIKLATEPGNTAAHMMYKGFGFLCTSHDSDTDIYTLIFNGNSTYNSKDTED